MTGIGRWGALGTHSLYIQTAHHFPVRGQEVVVGSEGKRGFSGNKTELPRDYRVQPLGPCSVLSQPCGPW